MIAVLLGPPGAGKSKQSELLKDREHITWLYVGKLLRQQSDPAIKEFVDSGKLVPDEVVNGLVANFINSIDPSKLVVIDGFPRHLSQAEWLVSFSRKSQHDLGGVVHLMLPPDVSKQRLAGRGREDDAPAIVQSRLEIYERDIAPVVGYFERQNTPIHPVDGNRPVEDVFKDMDRILNDVYQGKN